METIEKTYVVLNPIAGHASADEIRKALNDRCHNNGWDCEIYETTGEENVAEVTRKACEKGANLVIAAGGDGTVAGVVNGLINTQVPLGIIPVGTGNGLARALSIPLDVQEATGLLTGEHLLQPLDAMQVGDQYFVLNVSAGISSRAMTETPPEEKRKFGILAYAQKIIKDMMEVKTHIFNLNLDGHQVQVRAAEVLVANGEFLKEPANFFGNREKLNDGRLTVNIVTADSPTDYVSLAWEMLVDPKESKTELRDLTVRKSIILDVDGETLPVQADGEVIGETPVEVKLAPSAIRVVVPPETKA